MKVKIIFLSLPFSITQVDRTENWLFRNTLFSVLEYPIFEILIFESLIETKFYTSFCSLLQYYLGKNNGNFWLVITFLFIRRIMSNVRSD